MKIPHQQQQQTPVTINGRKLKEATSFTYLGSTISTTGGTGTDEDVKVRIVKARQAFISLKPVWRSSALSVRNKIRIFNTNVKSVLLYGSETWRVTKGISNKLQTFINNCLRCLVTEDQMVRKNKQQGALGMNQPRTYHPTNMQKEVEMDWAYTEKADWGHHASGPRVDSPWEATSWVSVVRVTWRRSCEEEMRASGLSWSQVQKISENRVHWRRATG
ncbi:unnamed protein product, partial [Heterobilharzia americana]